jgi:hypothetical protein
MLMVFDDAVMDYGNLIPANMRMRISRTGFTVGRPSGMRYSNIA